MPELSRRLPLLPSSPASGFTDQWDLEPGLSVLRSSVLLPEAQAEVHEQPPEQGALVLTFGLEGSSGFCDTRGQVLDFQPGFTTAAAFMGSRGERRLPGGQRVLQLRLRVQAAAVARLLGAAACAALLPRQGLRLLGSARTQPASQAHVLALARGLPGLSALDLRIHALSLLAAELRALGLESVVNGTPQASASRVSSREGEALVRARDLMAAHLDRPLTTAWLARSVGLSDTRFKAGFKAVFGLPPGQMLLQLRMARARVLLDAGCQVAQVAAQVGYAHPGNFSVAFARHTGHPPARRRPELLAPSQRVHSNSK